MAEPESTIGHGDAGAARVADPVDVAAPRGDSWDQATPTICLAIPGLWADREQMIRQLVRTSGRQFAILGNSIVRAADFKAFPFDIIEHDPLLADTFHVGSRGRILTDQLEAIARHTYTIYVRGGGGSTHSARDIVDMATALLRAGGLGVKVESSGSAVSREQWFKYADPAQPAGMYWAFVVLVRSHERGVYSCGMHTFGLRDVITSIKLEPEPLASLVHNFLGLTFATRPPLKDGDELSDDESGIAYRVRAEKCEVSPPGHMQHNPYGMWRLELVEDERDGDAPAEPW